MTVGGSYCVTSQVSLDVRPKIFTSSSIGMPTRIGPGDVLWFLMEAETHVGSFSGVETYSKTSSIGRSIVMVFSTCIAHPPSQPPRSTRGAYCITDDDLKLSQRQPRALESLIHWSAWNRYSANFAFIEFSEVRQGFIGDSSP